MLARSLPAKSRTSAGPDAAGFLPERACAIPFRVPLHSSGAFLLDHPGGAGNLLDRNDVRAYGDLAG